MGKRRGNGEGSIYQRKDGRWTASVTTDGQVLPTIHRDAIKKLEDVLGMAQE